MKTVNFTIQLEDDAEVSRFEHWLEQYVNIKDLKILPDTKALYENNAHFRTLTQKYYDAKRVREDYINEHLFI